MDLKEMREERAELVKEITKLRDLNNDPEHKWSAENEENWEQVNADYDKRTAQIERAERAEKLEAEQVEPVEPPMQRGETFKADEKEQRDKLKITEEQRALALQAWTLGNRPVMLRDEHREAAQVCGVDLASNEISLSLSPQSRWCKKQTESRALSAVTGSAGAFTIAEGFIPRLEQALLAYGGMLQVAETLTTPKGEDLPWPTTDDTSNKGRIIGENTTVTETDVTFGAMVLQAYQYSSDMVKVPFVLLQDSAFNLANVLGDMLGERLARILNEHFTTGTGAAQPYGIVNAATLGITTSVHATPADNIDWTEITDLIHAVDPAYRPGSRFMFHDSTMLYLRKLSDGEGRPLWQADPNGVAPSTLQGYPYTINQDMAEIATTNITMLFGQLSKYKVRMVGTLRLRRLEERYAELDQLAFFAYMRADGDLLDAGANPVKYIQQA